MTKKHSAARLLAIVVAIAIFGPISAAHAQGRTLAGVACQTPPPLHCAGEECSRELLTNQGNATEPKSGRAFFLDYPCDLKPNEQVTVILSLHGAGSIGNWQRHYFPAMDYKEKHRLVIATPTAATTGTITAGAREVRMWAAAADDEYLRNLTEYVLDQVGRRNVKSFWLAGHSQGGMTSNRIACTDFFKDKVDGWLSLSGGRIGPAQIAPDFFGPSGPPPTLSGAGDQPRPGVAALPACEMSYIFTSGELEITGLPATSPWAEKYKCDKRERRADIVDTSKGYVTGAAPGRGASWGREARPGTSQVFVYPKCRDGRVVADVLRMDKGHTEGLEPKVTESLVAMMASARGGKIRSGNTNTTAQATPSACDRECLRGFVTRYLDAMVAHNPGALPVAPNVRFTEDTVDMKLGEGLWKGASKIRPYRLDILDTAQGVAASQVVVEEAGTPVMLVLRLKVANRMITEVETQVTRNQKEGAIFAIEALQSTNAAMTAPVPAGKRSSRAEAIKLAEYYPAGLEIGSFVAVNAPFGATAYRFENGRLMAGKGCTFQPPSCEDIKGQKISTHPGLHYRVVAVDEELGITLLRINFGRADRYGVGNALIVWEAFKVYGGEIHAVEAFMKIMPADAGSGWDTDVRRPARRE